MKTLTRIFMAVAALVVVSCTTDATEDLGVKFDANGQTELALSLNESRTQLGEKAGDVYPLYWSEGDKIAVNGIVSDALAADAAGKTTAVFKFGESLTYPYNIVYPAPAEGVVASEGLQVVTFLATQTYKEGTFADGAAPMYAQVAAEDSSILLQHLSGVLRLALKGNGEVVKSITISTAKGKIAGNFDLDCATGVLTAQADATNTLTVDLGNGLTLGEVAAPIYAAVPAGEYGIVTITITTDAAENNAMIVRFDSDAHAVNAGKIKEFGEVVFAANATSAPESGELVIESEADLRKLAMLSESNGLEGVTSVRVAATIDMSNATDWSGINNFPAIIFDGGSDKGYEIKGLQAPLFGVVNGADIKNVKLTDVNIASADRNHLGALVCEYYGATATNAISNCEALGTIVVENKNYVAPTTNESLYQVVDNGGLVGLAFGVNLNDCTNRINITVKQVASQSDTTGIYPVVGGVAGGLYGATLADESVLLSTVTNCHNYGVIKYEDITTEFRYRPFIGGVIGVTGTNGKVTMTKCVNHGAVSMNAVVTGGSGANASAGIGGVVGSAWTSTLIDCENAASVTADGKLLAIAIGGHTGYSTSCIHEGCVNNGAVEIKATAQTLGIMAGGFAGALYDPNTTVGHTDNVVNNGTLSVLSSTMETTKTGAYYYRIGGITSFCRHNITNSTNNGDVITAGTIINVATGTERNIQIAGCVAYKTKGSVVNVCNYGNVTVNSDITTQSTDADVRKAQPLAIAGVVSDSSYVVNGCINKGTITVGGKFSGYRIFIAGIVANGIDNNVRPYAGDANDGDIHITKDAEFTLDNILYVGGCTAGSEASAINGLTNNGDIKIDCKLYGVVDANGDKVGGGARMGGVMGYFTAAHKNFVNNGDIEVGENYMCEGQTCLGGVTGYFYNTANDDAHTYDGYINNGKVSFKGTNTGTSMIGGVAGIPYGAHVTNATNNGAVLVDGEFNNRLYVGGCFGSHDKDKIVKLSNVSNNAPITVKGIYNSSSTMLIGGVIGFIQGADGHTKLYNNADGDITVNFTKAVGNIIVGGIATKIQDASSVVENRGDINVSGNYDGSVYISGGVTYTNAYMREYYVNYGNVNISSAKVGSALIIGGLTCYGQYGKTWTEAYNHGDITVSEDTEIGAGTYIGGMIGYFDSSSSNPIYLRSGNTGDIIFKGKGGVSAEAPSSTAYNKEHIIALGGLAGQCRANSTHDVSISEGFVNSGKIEFSGSNDNGSVYIGGLIGDMATPVTNWNGPAVNVGDIVCTGTYKNNCYVGGIFGKTTVNIPNGEAYFTMNASKCTGVGMITGSSRSESVKATNCKIGGNIMEWDDEDGVFVPKAIAESEFFNYIYGSGDATDWTGAENYDGCSFLSEKPAIQ